MAQQMSRLKKTLVIACVAALSLGGAGAAFAYWTSGGEGEGTAQTGEGTEFLITSEAPLSDLAPGSAGQTIAFTITNPGPGTQTLTTFTVALADAAGLPWVPVGNCLSADYTATISTAPAFGPILEDGIVSGIATVTLASTTVDQNDCKGQAVPLYFVAA